MHTEHEVSIRWHGEKEEEDVLVSVGEIFLTSPADERVIFSFTEDEWRNAYYDIKKKGYFNCGDFCITKINN